LLLPLSLIYTTAVDHLEFVGIDVAAQNMHQAESGAFTGEISADICKTLV
jgi:triosephosphate isomerase